MTSDPDQCILLPEPQKGELLSQRPEEERAGRPWPPALPLTSLIIEFSIHAHQQALNTKKQAPPDSVFAQMKPRAESVQLTPAASTRTHTRVLRRIWESGSPRPSSIQGLPAPPTSLRAVWLQDLSVPLNTALWGEDQVPRNVFTPSSSLENAAPHTPFCKNQVSHPSFKC